MTYAILGAYVVPPPDRKADADPDVALGGAVVTCARTVRLQPGDVVFFARVTPHGEFQVLDGSCEDWEGGAGL